MEGWSQTNLRRQNERSRRKIVCGVEMLIIGQNIQVKMKVKFSLEQAMKGQKGSRDTPLLSI
jgi:hypothetical protein